MINCTYKKSNKKVWAVIGLALIGGIFALLGNSLTVKANAQVLDDNFDYSVGVCTLDDHFKIETYDDVKGKYHKDNFCNRSFFCIYDGTYNSYNVFFAPKNGYYWSVGASYPQVPPTLLKNSYEMVDLTRGGSGGYPIQIGMRADSYEGFSFYEDTWNQGIDGLPNSNVTVGTGLILSRDVKYNKNLEKTYQPYQSISNLYNTLKNSPKRRMEVMRIKEECDLEITVCYELLDKGTMFWDKKYYNLRSDFEIRFRNNTQDLVLKDIDTNSELTNNHGLDGISGKTKNGFYIDTAGNKFYTVKYRKNGGSWTNLSNSQMKIDNTSSGYKTITEEGKYEIQYTNAFGKSFTQTVYIDKSEEPSVVAYSADNEKAKFATVDDRR